MDLHVRVKPKSGAQQFYRCGMLFTQAWAMVTVDDATARRLDEEQMLETSAEWPADFPRDTPPAELDASPVDPVSTTGEGVDAGASVQAQAEAEARAQFEAESAAESAPAKPAKKGRK